MQQSEIVSMGVGCPGTFANGVRGGPHHFEERHGYWWCRLCTETMPKVIRPGIATMVLGRLGVFEIVSATSWDALLRPISAQARASTSADLIMVPRASLGLVRG